MRIIQNGHSDKYLCECLALLFFPGASFENEGEPADGRTAVTELVRGEEHWFSRVTLTAFDRTEQAEETISVPEDGEYIRLLARCFYKAGEKLTGIRPPWGTLTGIRPAKVVKRAMDEGRSPEEAAALLAKEYFTEEQKTRLCVDTLEEEEKAQALLPERSFSLYLSIPFCPTRCSYCSFVSQTIERQKNLLPGYVDLLIEEIRDKARTAKELGLSLSTVYMGGGTPTTLSADQMDRVLSAVEKEFDLSHLLEFTVEAGRPDTVDMDKFRVLKAHNIGRISINPQTMFDATLKEIGRRHSVEQTVRAFELARAAGIPSINADLIAGLPGETAEMFAESLEKTLALTTDAVTVHTLCIKRAAQLRQTRDAVLAEHGRTTRMLREGDAVLRAAGLKPYYLYRQRNTVGNLENVGYAAPGHTGLYNIYIMSELQTIFAVGAGAVTKLVSKDLTHIERIFHVKYPYEYTERAGDLKKHDGVIRKFYEEYVD